MMFNQFIISAILGFKLAASSIVFDMEPWSLLKQTIAHFIIFSFIYFSIAICGRQIPKGNIARIKYIVLYVMIYIIAWFVFKAYWKRKTIEINKKLELRHK